MVVLVLIGMQNVGAVGVKEIGDGGDQSFAIGAIDEQNGGVSCFQNGLL